MPICGMWSNGFLQTLEIIPRGPAFLAGYAGWLGLLSVFGFIIAMFMVGSTVGLWLGGSVLCVVGPLLAGTPFSRMTLDFTDRWVIYANDGACSDARLLGAWATVNACIVGVTLERDDGRRLHTLLFSRQLDQNTWRRLQVRLRFCIHGA